MVFKFSLHRVDTCQFLQVTLCWFRTRLRVCPGVWEGTINRHMELQSGESMTLVIFHSNHTLIFIYQQMNTYHSKKHHWDHYCRSMHWADWSCEDLSSWLHQQCQCTWHHLCALCWIPWKSNPSCCFGNIECFYLLSSVCGRPSRHPPASPSLICPSAPRHYCFATNWCLSKTGMDLDHFDSAAHAEIVIKVWAEARSVCS